MKLNYTTGFIAIFFGIERSHDTVHTKLPTDGSSYQTIWQPVGPMSFGDNNRVISGTSNSATKHTDMTNKMISYG